MHACWRRHFDMVRALLNHMDVDVNVQDKNGRTALMFASCHDTWKQFVLC